MNGSGGCVTSIGIIAILVINSVVCVVENTEKKPDEKNGQDQKPSAEKLTVDIQSMSNRIPPQIAYFIPDRFLNQTNFDLFNSNSPPIVNIRPTPNNNNNNNGQSNRDNNPNNRNPNNRNPNNRNNRNPNNRNPNDGDQNNRNPNNRDPDDGDDDDDSDQDNRDKRNRDRNNRDRDNRDRRANRDRDRRNRRRNNRNRDRSDSSDYLDDDYSDSSSSQDLRDIDLFMSPQQTVRYVSSVPRTGGIQSFVNEDATTSYQNLDHQIDFTRIPDKKPDFTRFEELERAARKSIKLKKRHHKRRPDADQVDYNYANNAPNVRGKIASLKKYHRHEYGRLPNNMDDGEMVSGSNGGNRYGSDGDRGYTEHRWSQKTPSNKNTKLKKNRTKYQNSYYSTKHKLSQPISSAEMESVSASTDADADSSNEHYRYGASVENINHGNYDADNPRGVQTLQQFSETVKGAHKAKQKRLRPKKGFTILLTKVMKQQPSPYRVHRIDTDDEQLQQQQQQPPQQYDDDDHDGEQHPDENDAVQFVPTRLLSSVRETVKVKHLPRPQQHPSIKSKVIETGSHVVYTEDGYRDNNYDHGDEDRSIEYGGRTRMRRETNVKELRGQELMDHMDVLIRNVSDYLNSSEIIPKIKYPHYNETDDIDEESPIRYSEYAQPVVNTDFTHELYASKTRNCSALVDDIDIAVNGTDADEKKRLGTLEEQLECAKVTLFGEDPFDNPLFKEENITQPNGDKVLEKANNDAERIEAISSVYNDIMDNIKFNENQRIFSDFGVSDNLAIGTIEMHDETKTGQESATSEKPKQKAKRRKGSSTSTTTTTETFESDELEHLFEPADNGNPFRDPAQVPILDISRFIPTARYQTVDYNDETDFVPIVSPYTSYNQYRKPTTAVKYETTTIKYVPTTARSAPTYGLPQPNKVVSHAYSASNIVSTVQRPYVYVATNKNVAAHAAPNYKAPPNNVRIYKHRRPIQYVRIHKPNKV